MNPFPFIDESRLVVLVSDASADSRRWDERASCADLPGTADHYFPDEGDIPSLDALVLCVTCPVAHECLATALAHESASGLRDGWWGGYSPEERETLARRINIPTRQHVVDPRQPAVLARRLRSQSFTIPSIAAELGCTERTVYRYLAASAAA